MKPHGLRICLAPSLLVHLVRPPCFHKILLSFPAFSLRCLLPPSCANCLLWSGSAGNAENGAAGDASGTTPTAPTATCEHGAGACGGGQVRVRPLPCGGVAVATERRAGRMRRCGRRGRVRGVRCLGTSPAPCGSVARALGAGNKHVITSVGSLAWSPRATNARVAALSVYNGQTASRVTRLPASRRRLTPGTARFTPCRGCLSPEGGSPVQRKSPRGAAIEATGWVNLA